MKLRLLLAISLLLPTFVSADTVDNDDLVKRNGIFFKKFTNVPFTGKSVGRGKGVYKDGKLLEWYYDNGQLDVGKFYDDGKLISVEKYDRSGRLRGKATYKNNKVKTTCYTRTGEEKSCRFLKQIRRSLGG